MIKDPKAVHETALSDVFKTIDDIKKTVKSLDISDNGPLTGHSSIAKAVSNYTLVFPVICSKNISPSVAGMVSKAVEKNAASMIQRLFAARQAFEFKGDPNLDEYIKRFHKNINVNNLDSVFDLVTTSYDFAKDASGYKEAVIADSKNNINYYLPDPINETSINDFHYDHGVVSEGAADEMYRNKLDDLEKDIKDIKDTVGRIDSKNNYSRNLKTAKDTRDLMKTTSEIFKNQALDSDYKKANELMPTMMTVQYNAVNPETKAITNIDGGIIGIKAKLYPISSNDIIDHLGKAQFDSNFFVNFFRATTREISFLKDFVLGIDKAKIDALSMSERKSSTDRMWAVLERRANNSRLKQRMGRNNDASAITTLVISSNEVDYMRRNNNVDLEKISTIKNLFNTLNLLSVCIVDEELEVAKFIFDENDPRWETLSFTHLERESSDNTYKRVVNLMTKMSR